MKEQTKVYENDKGQTVLEMRLRDSDPAVSEEFVRRVILRANDLGLKGRRIAFLESHREWIRADMATDIVVKFHTERFMYRNAKDMRDDLVVRFHEENEEALTA